MAAPEVFTKRYTTPQAAARAAAHHTWLRGACPGLAVPALLARRGTALDFEHIPGRHVLPGDLAAVAALLGRVHASAHRRRLGAARTNQPYRCGTLVLEAFTDRRPRRITELLAAGLVPSPALTAAEVARWILGAAPTPAAFYKDANPRNFLITPGGGTAVVDFDTLTLAPLGYDLAKLVVALVMTHGPIPGALVREALERYNTPLAGAGLPRCGVRPFAAWTEIHHILTAPYLGRNGYRYSWHTARPGFVLSAL